MKNKKNIKGKAPALPSQTIDPDVSTVVRIIVLQCNRDRLTRSLHGRLTEE